MKGKVNINDDVGLEKEADVLGGKANRIKYQPEKKELQESNEKVTQNNSNRSNLKFSNQRKALGVTPVQRWNIRGPSIDWAQTQSVIPLVSRPVLFFIDGNNDRVVVKGEDVSIGKTRLANMLHHQIHGTEVVFTRDITGDKGVINDIIDDPGRSGHHDNWAKIPVEFPKILPDNYPNLANLEPDEKGRKSREEHLNFLPKLQVMDFVPNKTAKDLSEVGGNEGGYQTMRALLLNKSYVQRLGKITAVDLFLENDDRVLAGNLGNWMNDADGNITLSDQLNGPAMALLDDDGTGVNGIIGPATGLDMLASARVATTAQDCVIALLHAMQHQAEDTTVVNWADEHGGAIRNKLETQLAIGIRQGISELKKHLNSNKKKRKGREIKSASGFYENHDIHSGDAPTVHFWDRLKARARRL